MNPKLIIEATTSVRMEMDLKAFKTDESGAYIMDDWVMCFMDLVEGEIPEGFRPVAVHVVPYTVVDGNFVYYVFQTQSTPEVFVSFPIQQDDFVGKNTADQTMSLCRTIVGKVVQVFDQPHLEITLDTDNFKFPAVINGEFVWTIEIKGDNNQSVDDLVAQLGTVIGRTTLDDIENETSLVGSFSKKVITPFKEKSNDITV